MIFPPPIYAYMGIEGPIQKPCVNCEQDAAEGWLLCLSCVPTITDQLVLDLAAKCKRYEIWLEDAEKVLRAMTVTERDTYLAALPIWARRFWVHSRLTMMLNRVGQG